MTKRPGLLARIEAIEHRAAITALIHAYALNIRIGRDRDCVALFTEDGVFEVRTGTPGDPAASQSRICNEGREAVSAYLAQSQTGGTRVCPLISNIIVDLHGDAARSTCAMTTTIWPNGARLTGYYEDSFRREGDRWLFAERIFTILGQFA
jgi:hypothetical protein